MNKITIKIKFQNGINFNIAMNEILNELTDIFQFEESSAPDFIIFGPYGNDIPRPGNYTRIGYYCENVKPDLSICDWAFGIPHEDDINDYRYKRIQWHGLNPQVLVKPGDYDVESIFAQKKHFCNFLYSHKVSYREEFFRQLSKYKKVDAPGQSMNNMQAVNNLHTSDGWRRKRQFLNGYKFTIAFENYVYPGYQTEKLYDAMQANSIPIYCGDPGINSIFNTASFINTGDFISLTGSSTVNWLQKHAQPDFNDIRPAFYNSPFDKIKRKLKTIGRQSKMYRQFNKFDFSPIIKKIIELDQDDNKYMEVLKQPWFIDNTPPQNASLKNRWIEIFQSVNNNAS